MMRRAIWSRLWVTCALLGLAGCEQSYSSPPAPRAATATDSAPAAAGDDQPVDAPAPPETVSAAATEEPAAASPVEGATQVETTTQVESATPASTPAADAAKLPTKDLTFDDIKFDIEKDGAFERSMLTPEIEALVGRTVRIRGYILPTFQQTGIRNFVLVRDNMECCFGPGAALYDCIVVDMVAGQSTNFTTRPVAVEGTFSIRELLDFDGVVRAIYHLEGKAVK